MLSLILPLSLLLAATGGDGWPAGAIIISLNTCPPWFSEVAELDGVTLVGTVTSHGDVGTTGGSDLITPVGSVSAPAFTGSSGVVPAQSFTGNAWTPPVLSWPIGVPTAANESAHTHSVTAAGTNGTGTVTPLGSNGTGTVTPLGSISIGTFVNVATATTGNCAATNTLIGTGAANSCKATAPNLTVPAEGHSGSLTFAGSSSITSAQTFTGSSSVTSAQTFTGSPVTSGVGSAHTHTLSWPAGVPTIATYTPTGFNSTVNFTPTGSISTPNFTGTQFDNRSSYIKVIFCRRDY